MTQLQEKYDLLDGWFEDYNEAYAYGLVGGGFSGM